jgi:primosomal protein N' (replication factor Y) (superfamily II helicase)
VIVQTSLPTHYVVTRALEHDFVGFAEQELAAREHPLYPPLCRLVNVVVSALEEGATQRGAEAAAEWLGGLLRSQEVTEVEIVGPAPCAIDRIRGRWRWHLLLRSENSALLGRITRYFAQRFDLPNGKDELRIAIDRDPIALL